MTYILLRRFSHFTTPRPSFILRQTPHSTFPATKSFTLSSFFFSTTANGGKPLNSTEGSTGNVSDHTTGDTKANRKGDTKAEPKSDAKAEPKSDAKAEPKSDAKAEPKGDPKAEPNGDVKGDFKDHAAAADSARISPEEMSKFKKYLEKNPQILTHFRKVCDGYAYYQTATSVVKDTVNIYEGGKRLLEEGFPKTPGDALKFVTGKPKYSLEDQLRDLKDELEMKMKNGFSRVHTDIEDLRYDLANIMQNVTKEACPYRITNPKKVHNISPSATGKKGNGKEEGNNDEKEEDPGLDLDCSDGGD